MMEAGFMKVLGVRVRDGSVVDEDSGGYANELYNRSIVFVSDEPRNYISV
jgi:hypothetical protein